MSTTISISLYAEQDCVPKLLYDLIDRMGKQSLIRGIKLHEGFYLKNVEEVNAQDRQHLMGVAEKIQFSNRMLRLDMGYQLRSGREVGIDVVVPGTKFERGHEFAVNGPLTISLSLNAVSRPLKDLVEQPDYRRDEAKLLTISTAVQRDWDEIFFRACGVQEVNPERCCVEHGAMYLELGWPSAVGCAMLYHQDKKEFARDFLRVYREFFLGDTLPKMLAEDFDLEDGLAGNGSQRNDRVSLAFYKQFDTPGGDSLVEFLNDLDVETARSLAQLSGEEVDELLQEASKEIIDIAYFDFGSDGGALVASPLASVWRAYQYIATIAT